MLKITNFFAVTFLGFWAIFCLSQNKIKPFQKRSNILTNIDEKILPADYNLPKYFSKLQNRKVGLVVHPCSIIQGTTLVDTLKSLGIKIEKIFAPEHGFRGNGDAGEIIEDSMDVQSKIPVISLYGNHKKPTREQLQNIDVMVFDLQDVGVRFFTYLSTLHYIMEACALYEIELIILDRPNPNGFYVDGPVLDSCCHSFIGIHPIPIVHGMTLGELAKMIMGEHWISNASRLKLEVIRCKNYTHNSHYVLPVKPSPNLPNERSILLYPGICLLEGTILSVGRGTDLPFQLYGHPDMTHYDTIFTPKSRLGAKNPLLQNRECKGILCTKISLDILHAATKINLSYIIRAKKELKNHNDFFLPNQFINLLAGNVDFKEQILNDVTEDEIRKSWSADLNRFKKLRKKYLLYQDFE